LNHGLVCVRRRLKYVAGHRHVFLAHEHPKSEAAPCQVLTHPASGMLAGKPEYEGPRKLVSRLVAAGGSLN
jgi:hypothetical protein